MSERMAPQHCPYCGEEDLRPSGPQPGTWECRCCRRVFRLGFVGLSVPGKAEESA